MSERLTIDSQINELQGILSDKFQEFINEKEITEIIKTSHQSSEYMAAGMHLIPSLENKPDRFIFTVKLAENKRVFVITGKYISGPYKISWQGVDLRETRTVVFVYDGKSTIVATNLATGETDKYTGILGQPETLMPHLTKTAGRSITSEIFLR